MFFNLVHIGLFFQADPPASGNDETKDDPPPPGDDNKDDLPENWTPEQQKEFDKRARALKKAAEDEGKKKAKAEFEATQKAEKDEAEKKRLKEEGKLTEALGLAETAKNEADKRAEAAEARAKELELKDLFNSHVADEEISFNNPQARKDAFAALDRETVKDAESMAEAITAMQKSHPHYFGEVSKNGNTDATKNGRRTTTKQDEKKREAELKSRYNIRAPR